MKNKHSKSILSGDTIIRVPIILLLIAYASTKYEVSNIVESILIVCGISAVMLDDYYESSKLMKF